MTVDAMSDIVMRGVGFVGVNISDFRSSGRGRQSGIGCGFKQNQRNEKNSD